MQNTEELIRNIEALAREWDVSAGVVLMKDGETLLRRSYGWADRAAGVPLAEKNTFCLSQRSHMLLGLCLLKLQEERKLSLNDSIDRWLPEYPHAGRMTLRQLCTRRSGLTSYRTAHILRALDADEEHAALSSVEKAVRESYILAEGKSFAEVLEILKDEPLECEPGSEPWGDTDTSAVFLAEVIERAAGVPLFDYEKRVIFDSCGMTVREGDVSDTATWGALDGKEIYPLKKRPDVNYVFTTDLESCRRLTEALTEQRLLSAKSWREARHFDKENDCGIGFENANGLVGGFIDEPYGYTLMVLFDPENRLGWCVVMNEEGKMELRGAVWYAFRPDLRREVIAFFQRLTAPKLVRLTKSNFYNVLDLELTEEQKYFVMPPGEIIAYAYLEKNWRPWVLTDCGRVIGLLALEIDKKRGNFHIGAVLIDRRYQRRGYGRFMVSRGIEMLKAAGAKELTIGVNRKNVGARKLYESLGFRPANVYNAGMELKLTL